MKIQIRLPKQLFMLSSIVKKATMITLSIILSESVAINCGANNTEKIDETDNSLSGQQNIQQIVQLLQKGVEKAALAQRIQLLEQRIQTLEQKLISLGR